MMPYHDYNNFTNKQTLDSFTYCGKHFAIFLLTRKFGFFFLKEVDPNFCFYKSKRHFLPKPEKDGVFVQSPEIIRIYMIQSFLFIEALQLFGIIQVYRYKFHRIP